MMMLPLAAGECSCTVSPALIADIEATHGSLYLIAEKLVDRSLTVTAMLDMVKIAYRHSGQAVDDAFLLGQDCTEILSGILMAILQPMERPRHLPPAHFMDDMLRREAEGK